MAITKRPRSAKPTEAEIREGMNQTLWRCMTYYRIQAAIKRAAEAMAANRSGSSEEVVA